MATRPSTGGDLELKIEAFKGYNSRDDFEFREDGVITYGRNMSYEYPVGSTAKTYIVTRLGYTKRNPVGLPDRIQGGKIFKKSTDSFYRCVVVSAGNIYEAQFVNSTDVLTFTQITSFGFSFFSTPFATTSEKIRMVQMNDQLFIADGVNKCRNYDGTTVNEFTITVDDARPSVLMVHQNRLWVNSTTPGYRNQLYWSTLNDPTNFTFPVAFPVISDGSNNDAGTQLFKGFPDESSPITTLASYSAGLMVHQARKVWYFQTTGAPYPVDGNITWKLIEMRMDVGCLSQDLLATLGDKHMYMTDRGVNSMAGVQALQGVNFSMDSVNATPLSYDIEPDLFNTVIGAGCATYYKFYYILNVPSSNSGANNIAFVFDVRRNYWLPPWDNYQFSQFDVANINDDSVCYAFSDVDGFVYTLFDNFQDDTDNIRSFFRTNAIDYKDPKMTKSFRTMHFWPLGKEMYLRYSVDYGPFVEFGFPFKSTNKDAVPLGQFVLGVNKLGSGFLGQNQVRIVNFRGKRGRHISFEFDNNNMAGTGTEQPFGLLALNLRSYKEDDDQRTPM